MPTTKPLTKRQRERADKAHQFHEELLRLRGAADVARAKRDAHLRALLGEGVTEAVVVNETGVSRGVVSRVGRGLQ